MFSQIAQRHSHVCANGFFRDMHLLSYCVIRFFLDAVLIENSAALLGHLFGQLKDEVVQALFVKGALRGSLRLLCYRLFGFFFHAVLVGIPNSLVSTHFIESVAYH